MWFAPFHIKLAVKTLNQGGVIAYPTESVFGLGCDPLNRAAIKRLLILKSRPAAKGLILVASEIEQLEPYVDFSKIPDLTPLLASWPGFSTWVVPARKTISPLLCGDHGTLAVRISAHPMVRNLCQQFRGAITSTSANRMAQREARDQFSIKRIFKGQIDYYVPGETLGESKPSRITHALTGQVIRE